MAHDRGYMIGYEIDGFFGTKKGWEHLMDIVARFILTFRDLRPQRLDYKPRMMAANAYYSETVYRLRDLRWLKSLPKKKNAPLRADGLGGDDYPFYAIKLYTEDLIREFGEGTPVPYSMIEQWAFQAFGTHKKGLSTVRAKCRSVWQWYDDRGWTIPRRRKKKDPEEVYMTRRERAISNARAKAEKARRAVITAVTGLYADDYRKKSGAWHIGKIAEATGLHRDVVSKYLKEWEAEQQQGKGNAA